MSNDLPASDPAVVSPKVLVVDDDVGNAILTSRLLKHYGYETRIAHSGKEAIAAVAEFQPRIVLLDIGLPDMAGYDVAATLRKDPAGAQLALIALTGFDQDEQSPRAQAARFDCHLLKPVKPDVLRQTLESYST